MKVKFKIFLFNIEVPISIDIPEEDIKEFSDMDEYKELSPCEKNDFIFSNVEQMLNEELMDIIVEDDIEIDGKSRDLSYLRPVIPWHREEIEGRVKSITKRARRLE